MDAGATLDRAERRNREQHRRRFVLSVLALACDAVFLCAAAFGMNTASIHEFEFE